MNNLWGLRLLAVFIAGLMWFFVTVDTFEAQSIKVIDSTVSYDVPEGFVILEPIDRVKVTVRGAASTVRTLNPFQVDLFVELPDAKKGTVGVNLTPAHVALADNLEVLSIEPNQITLTLDTEETGMLPVDPELVGEPAAGAVVQQPSVDPPLVVVRGPSSRLTRIKSVTTTPVRLDGHALDFYEQAVVVSTDPLVKIVQPAVVTVHVPLQIPGANGGNPG